MTRSGTAVCGAAVLGLLVSGCGGGGTGGPAPSTAAPVTSSPTTPTPPAPSPHRWPHLAAAREVEQGRFATSLQCASCHSGASQAQALRDARGRGVAPFDLWQASMMANAARDPLFRAAVSVEIAATPAARAAIEAKCLQCHSPMAAHDARTAGDPVTLDLLRRDDGRGQLALDGVSCTYCHQIDADPAVAPSTFGGQAALVPYKDLLGPYDAPQGTPMLLRTGYLPRKGDHVRSSAQCASCHTLFTSAVGPDGAATGGRLPEQTAYLEWQNSAFDETRAAPGAQAASCSACHAPQRDEDGAAISTRIARDNGGADYPNLADRDPFGRHLFVGGNTLVPAMLRDARADLRPLAPDGAFDAVIAAARRQLRQETARVVLATPTRAGDTLHIPARVVNLTGHKLPTGHPTRRLWLRLRVTDAAGRRVFASGEHDAAGRLVDATGQPLPQELLGGPLPAHLDRITAEEQVQVWQSVMRDGAGSPTFLLLRAEGYWKDDRLLPAGWDPAHPAATDTAPAGLAGDPDFGAGGDTVTYEVVAPASRGPYTVEATVLYQPLGARYAAELLAWRTPEVEALEAYYAAADRRPEVVAEERRTAN